MNRKEILNILKKLNFPQNEFVVLSGASLVVQQVKSKTNDIDIGVSEALFKKLKKLVLYTKRGTNLLLR